MGSFDIEKQYKLAIDARDKLTDNYYKWMSYYYLANAAVLVAITQLAKNDDYNALLVLSVIGVFVCLLWHLSCKGYYYWSKSWINIIIRFEKHLLSQPAGTEEHPFKEGVYSVFSREVAEQKETWNSNRGSNISTPKLTLIFSFLCIYSWLTYAWFQFFNVVAITTSWKLALIVISYPIVFFLPMVFKKEIASREENSHNLV